jgi:hypothetical protein
MLGRKAPDSIFSGMRAREHIKEPRYMAGFTKDLERAIAKAATLTPADQNTLAALLLAEIEDVQAWEKRFADPRSPDLLKRLAAEALAEDDAGLTEPLPSQLTLQAGPSN